MIIKKLFVLGFSAGAHLALLLGNKYYYYISKLVLLYPVTTSKRKIAHNESFKYLLGKEEYRLRYKDFYIEKIIHNEMPETFVFHTEDDDIVNVLGVYKLAEAYSKMKVPLHLHVFPKGRHGLSTIEKRVAFIDQSEEEFIKDNDFVKSYISLMIDFLRK
ncbi:MAG: prolyl oligopeptidase family serine peptidase [Bacillales bacterium]|nr:prolyl oligopeptidase family serine peptidase [Bacillales bacterium]